MNFDPASVPQDKVKDEPVETFGIIDLDLKKTPEDLVDEWDAKVKIKFKKCIAMDSEQHLNTLMRWYIRMIKEEAVDFEDYKKLKLVMANHLQFFKIYFAELNCCFVDNYLDNLEEILLFYFNLEIKSQLTNKKNGCKRRACHLISLLNMYLLNKESRMSHILMKLKLNVLTEESKNLLNYLYKVFLTKEPKNKLDMDFCRAYILYQKWKMVRKRDDWKKMDEIMYTLYDRTPDCIESNPILKKILLPQNKSILDTLTYTSQNHLILDQYFKYMKSVETEVDGIDDVMPSMDGNDRQDIYFAGDEEDRELEVAYKDFVKSLSSLHVDGDETASTSTSYNVESDDDDCQIVSVHEISDADMEIISVQNHGEKQITPRKDKNKNLSLSFLDSIELTQDSIDSTMEIVTSSKINGSDQSNKKNNLMEKKNNLMETSDSSAKIVADSATNNNLGEKSVESDMITSEADMKSVTEAESSSPQVSELCKSVSNTNITGEVSASEKAVGVASISKSTNVDKKSVVTQTQTDWHRDCENGPPFETRSEESGIQQASTTRHVIQEHTSQNAPTPSSKTTVRPSTSTNYRENDSSSTDDPCNSPDFLISSQGSCTESNTTLFNKQSKSTDISSTSADVTSTSTDVQDFSETHHDRDINSVDQVQYHQSPTICQVESNFVSEESYCAEEYVEYESSDNVTQSNLADEIYIEGHNIVLNNGGELTYILYDSLPVGANVNICTEEVSCREVIGATDADNRNTADIERESNGKQVHPVPLHELKVAVQKPGLNSTEKRRSSSKKVTFSSEEDFSDCPIPRTTQDVSDITSPPYEEMDSRDYKIFLRQNKMTARQFSSLQKPAESVAFVSAMTSQQNPKRPINGEALQESIRPNKKEKRVHIAKTFLESQNSVPQLTVQNMESNLKSILKKSPSKRQLRKREKLRIAKVAVNLKSLEQYKVPPDDVNLHRDPYVCVERLRDPEIRQWLRISELSKKVRLEKEKSHHVPSLPIRVDYTNKNKVSRYESCGSVTSVPEIFGECIQNSVIREEGFRELSYMEKKTGKRKRQSDTMQNSSTPGTKARTIYDKSSASGVRKTTRKRKKPEKDYDSLTVNGY